MATSSSVSLLLLALITTTILAQDHSPSPSQSPSQLAPPPPPFSTTHTPLPPPFSTVPLPPLSTTPPPPTPSEIKKNQLKNILDALIGAGDFGGWANVLSSADPSAFPLTATLFIPSDDATSHYAAIAAEGKSFDPFLIPYHIIPQRLTFADLRRFATHTRLPTLLPAKFIAITNNSAANFTVDDSQITQADIFTNAAFAVHGVNNILNYTVYGGGSGSGGRDSPPPVHANPWRPKPTLEPPRKRNPVFPGEITVSVKSGAWRPCGGILMILVAIIHLHQEFS